MDATRVILLPGGVLPAELAYGALVAALGDEVYVAAKDLEVYAGDAPPENYGLDVEVEGVLRLAETRGWDRFHLGGYSAGGAAALAVAARHPDRLLSLALLEPAWAGNQDLTPAEAALRQEYERIQSLPGEQFMAAFVRFQLKQGVEPPAPPAGEPPPWMARRPAGLRAITNAFKEYDLDLEALRRFSKPVYYALGGLSNPDQYEEIATRLARVFSDFELDVFAERHHFDPPHRVEPDRLAAALRALWRRAEQPSSLASS